MFNFFANLACSIYLGSWSSLDNKTLITIFVEYLSQLPIFGLFNNSDTAFYSSTVNLSTSADIFNASVPPLAITIAVILSTICCISVFFIIVKAFKKLFNVFLGD